jgi:tetratricopeptide (TPR) repeat protein
MKRRKGPNAFWLVGLLAGAGGAAETVEYAEPDGALKSAPVVTVNKDEEKEFSARVLLGGRPRRLDIPSRRVISFRRGDPDAVNQWSKRLATGLRLAATGQLATQGTVPGAEETFEKIAYTMEKGVPGEEAAYAALPWHNQYALFYLIETRYRMGAGGDKAKLQQALASVEEFRQRSVKKATIDWEVPAEKGATKKSKVFCWGDSRLMPEVLLLEARILAALGEKEKALAAFDAVIERAKKGDAVPHVLTDAFVAKAEFEAAGQPSEQQESLYRAAGSVLSSLARNQPDDFGKQVVTRAANRALLRGADLLRESAEEQKVTWDTPLGRYQQLKGNEGQRDPALYVGAQAGLGACLVEKGQGEAAYKALLEVIVQATGEPDQMALALYYIGRAAKLFGDEIDSQGGKGDFLRAEAERWWNDLKERYPTSRWAGKAK